MHEKLNYYEVTAVLLPGYAALALAGYSSGLVEVHDVLELSFGGFSAITLAAFVLGIVVSAISREVARVYDRLWGGLPSVWPASGRHHYLTQHEHQQLRAMLPQNASKKEWQGLFHEAMLRARSGPLAGRVERFLGNYALARSFATLGLVSVPVHAVLLEENLWVTVVLAAATALAFRSMHKAGVQFAHDIYKQLLINRRDAL